MCGEECQNYHVCGFGYFFFLIIDRIIRKTFCKTSSWQSEANHSFSGVPYL